MIEYKKIKKLTVIFLLISIFGCNRPNDSLLGPGNQEQPTEKFIISSVRNSFDEYDLNKDGFIELSELSQAPKSFKEMDKNNDGKLTFEEAQPSVERVKNMSIMINKYFEDLYKNLGENDTVNVTAKILSSSDELEPFRESESWNKSLTQISALNDDKVITLQQFNSLMNVFFLDLSYEQQTFKSAGLWRWLKEKFGKDDNNVISKKNPVILVHGYAEPGWYFMYGIYRNLKKTGRDVFPVNLFPNIGDIKEQSKLISAKIEQIKKERNAQKVDYVCHSMGGLIGRYYIQSLKGENNIDHFVTIATPHYGTYISWLGIGEGAKQMRPGSDFLNELNKEPIKGKIKYTSIWTKTDEIVIPSESAQLRGSNIMPDINFVGHLLILWAPKAYNQIRDVLEK